MQLTEGAFHTAAGMSVFGAIGDSAPDRWGPVLMRRWESLKAKTEKRSPVTLFELDYLLGVNDEARQGALRFSLELDEPIFLAAKDQNSIPPLVSLPKLLSATERFLEDDEYNIVVWEAVALSLAKLAGIRVPDWRLETILKKPVLITRRFDRNCEERIPFLSAMSMLGARDNELVQRKAVNFV